MLAKLAADAGLVPVEPPQPPADFGSYDETIETQHQCPKCGYRFSGGKGVPTHESDSGRNE